MNSLSESLFFLWNTTLHIYILKTFWGNDYSQLHLSSTQHVSQLALSMLASERPFGEGNSWWRSNFNFPHSGKAFILLLLLFNDILKVMVGGYKGKSCCPFFLVKSENKANKLFFYFYHLIYWKLLKGRRKVVESKQYCFSLL